MTPDALSVMLECAKSTGATAVTCNCVDAVTGGMTGTGLTHDGRMTAADAAKARGEFWGLTQTSLLGDLRFDERLPGGFENVVWLPLDRLARRYYLHRPLRIYHSEGADRVTAPGRRRVSRDKVRILSALGENRAYLTALRAADPQGYRRTMVRVRVARLLRPVLAWNERPTS